MEGGPIGSLPLGRTQWCVWFSQPGPVSLAKPALMDIAGAQTQVTVNVPYGFSNFGATVGGLPVAVWRRVKSEKDQAYTVTGRRGRNSKMGD